MKEDILESAFREGKFFAKNSMVFKILSPVEI